MGGGCGAAAGGVGVEADVFVVGDGVRVEFCVLGDGFYKVICDLLEKFE